MRLDRTILLLGVALYRTLLLIRGLLLLAGVALSALGGLGGCSGMSEQMTVGFVKGMRAVPEYDFTPGEKERVVKVKNRFETLFEQEIKKKLEQRGLEGLKGWMVLLRFQSDGFTKTASLSLYTYWGQEERHDIYAIPLERFLDESQTVELADKATEEVTDYLSQKAGPRQTLLADPGYQGVGSRE